MRHLSLITYRAISSTLFMLLLTLSVNAQFRAGIQGTVSDPTGAVIPGATVTLTNNETNRTQQTTASDEGFYRFSQLAPGQYTLSVEQAGFKKSTIENVVVSAEETSGLDVTLTTGEVAETVTVTSSQGPQLET